MNFYSLGVFCSDSAISFVTGNHHANPLTKDTIQRIDMLPTGSNLQPIQRLFKTGKDTSAGYLNYFLGFVPNGNGVNNVYGYSRVVYKNIYTNIDMHVYSSNTGTKLYFVCNTGGTTHPNPANIELKFNGADSVKVTSDSGLNLYTHLEVISFAPGDVYEDSAGIIVQKLWKANFEKVSAKVVRFHTGTFNSSEPLIIRIDRGHRVASYPPIQNVDWSTYHGGTNLDDVGYFYDVTHDASDNVYTTGYTNSTGFPVLNGIQLTSGGGGYNDAIAVKFDKNYIRKWATYYGGNNNDVGNGIGVDASGNTFITGTTYSTNIPTVNPGGSAYYQPTFQGSGNGSNAFIVKISPSGNSCLWATYYGGSGSEVANHLAIDNLTPNNLYIVGGGASSSTPLKTEVGAYNNTYQGAGFIAKFNTSNGVQEWGTTIGTNGLGDITNLYGCVVDANANLYLTGVTEGTGYPVTTGGFAFAGAAFFDAIVTCFNSSNAISWSTYYGGDGEDIGQAITVDGAGNAYITGQTFSPTTSVNIELHNPGGTAYYQATNGNGTGIDYFRNCFIAEFALSGSTLNLIWGTYFGGNSDLYAEAITIDKNENLFITGAAGYVAPSYTGFIFPAGHPASAYYQTGIGTSEQTFLSVFNNATYYWGTYFGGELGEVGYGLTDYNGTKLYLVGMTGSYPTVFPLVDAGSGAWFQSSAFEVTGAYNIPFISEFDMSVIAGVNELNNSDTGEIVIYPNPTIHSINVQMDLKQKQKIELIIYNSIGQLVYNDIISGDEGRLTHKIDVSSLSNGVYLLRINEGNNFYTKKFVKQE
jgi:hypothetical protein